MRYRDPVYARILESWSAPRRALFLDRDGVVNKDRHYVHTPEATFFLDGIFELCAEAWRKGFAPIIVTNQAGIARGLYSEAQFLEYTQWMHGEFRRRNSPLVATYYCPHHPSAGIGQLLRECECRKPRPGMLLEAAAEFDIDLADSMLIGDSVTDLQAAAAADIGRTQLFAGDQLPALEKLLN